MLTPALLARREKQMAVRSQALARTETETWEREFGRKFDIPAGSVCLVSERVWILLTGVDTPFRFPSTRCELSEGNVIEPGQRELLKAAF